MSSQLGFSKPQIGIVLGCFGLGSVCGSWLGGWLTDRFGNVKVQAWSLILVIPLFLLLPQFTSFHSLALMIFALSLVADTFRPANSVSVARYAKPENITRAYSLNRMAINLGFSIGPALGGFLAKFSYDWIFYGNAIAAAAAAIVFIYFSVNGNRVILFLKTLNRRIQFSQKNPSEMPTSTVTLLSSIYCVVYSRWLSSNCSAPSPYFTRRYTI